MTRREYEPPTDDDAPLDAVELAIIRALVPVIVADIKRELLAEVEQKQLGEPDERPPEASRERSQSMGTRDGNRRESTPRP